MNKLEQYTLGIAAMAVSMILLRVTEPDGLFDLIGTGLTATVLMICGLILMLRGCRS